MSEALLLETLTDDAVEQLFVSLCGGKGGTAGPCPGQNTGGGPRTGRGPSAPSLDKGHSPAEAKRLSFAMFGDFAPPEDRAKSAAYFERYPLRVFSPDGIASDGPMDPRYVGKSEQVLLKKEVAKNVGDRMSQKTGRPQEECQREAKRYVNEWAKSSGDSDPEAVAMQMAIRDELQLGDSAELSHLDTTTRHGSDHGLQPSAQEAYEKHGESMRAFARATYDETQAWFAKRGITTVTVYRGVVRMPELENGLQDVSLQPASSFTSEPDAAIGFAVGEYKDQSKNRRGSAVLMVRVPVSRVFSTSRTGPGCAPESEVVLLGGGKTRAVVVVHPPRVGGFWEKENMTKAFKTAAIKVVGWTREPPEKRALLTPKEIAKIVAKDRISTAINKQNAEAFAKKWGKP